MGPLTPPSLCVSRRCAERIEVFIAMFVAVVCFGPFSTLSLRQLFCRLFGTNHWVLSTDTQVFVCLIFFKLLSVCLENSGGPDTDQPVCRENSGGPDTDQPVFSVRTEVVLTQISPVCRENSGGPDTDQTVVRTAVLLIQISLFFRENSGGPDTDQPVCRENRSGPDTDQPVCRENRGGADTDQPVFP